VTTETDEEQTSSVRAPTVLEAFDDSPTSDDERNLTKDRRRRLLPVASCQKGKQRKAIVYPKF